MQILNESIYDHPKYYDLVFGADCAAETRFVLGIARQFLSRPPRRMFEPACGTGRLLYALARKGYEVTGLDLNPRAVEYCNRRFERHGMPHRAFVADMADFRIRPKCDIAFNTINSFRHLDSEAAAAGHFDCMARAIRTGGVRAAASDEPEHENGVEQADDERPPLREIGQAEPRDVDES